MNQHIESAQQHLGTAEDWGNAFPPQMSVSDMALLSIAESLLSIAKSLHAIELEDEQIRRNADEVGEPNNLTVMTMGDFLDSVGNEVKKTALGLPGEICEICQENVGVTNSRHILDDYAVGIWVCLTCEQEAEEEFYLSEGEQ